jgi:hypothetical protein
MYNNAANMAGRYIFYNGMQKKSLNMLWSLFKFGGSFGY